MGRATWDAEAVARYEAAMGRTLAGHFLALMADVLELHLNWGLYEQVYAKSAERVELLNASSPIFFGRVESLFWDDVILRLNRLTEPAQGRGGRDQNLSLERLVRLLEDTSLREQGMLLLGDARAATKDAEAHRHKAIAHSDYAVALGEPPTMLPPLTHGDVRRAIAAVDAVVSAVDAHFVEGNRSFDLLDSEVGAFRLAQVLHWGILARRGMLDAMKRGEEPPEDFLRVP